jgi:hypothetical protein
MPTDVEYPCHYQIKRASLAAAALMVSHNETRPYICGVAIQPAPDVAETFDSPAWLKEGEEK